MRSSFLKSMLSYFTLGCSTGRFCSRGLNLSSTKLGSSSKAITAYSTSLLEHPDLLKFGEFLFDCDGVLWYGSDVIEGSINSLKLLTEMGKDVKFITNNCSKTRQQYVAKLKSFGFITTEEKIITSGSITSYYIQKLLQPHSKKLVYMIGNEALESELGQCGIDVVKDLSLSSSHCSENDFISYKLNPDVGAVVLGWDPSFSFTKLAIASKYIQNGCPFIVTNDDAYDKMGEHNIPGTGALCAALQMATGKDPIVCGKPSDILIEYILSSSVHEASNIMMIGDRLDTDITFANKAGFSSCVVLTGSTSRLVAENVIKDTAYPIK
eukprot:gene45287-60488_t